MVSMAKAFAIFVKSEHDEDEQGTKIHAFKDEGETNHDGKDGRGEIEDVEENGGGGAGIKLSWTKTSMTTTKK